MWTLAIAGALVVALGATVAGSDRFAPSMLEALKSSEYIYVATRRADGTQSKVVPVWFTYEDDAIYFTTAPDSHKAKRIAQGSPLLVWVGSEQGPHFEARAELVKDPAIAARMGERYNQKYWIAWLGFFRPRADRVASGKTVIVKVPAPTP